MNAGGEPVRPLLFLDVDGPLIPSGGPAPRRSSGFEAAIEQANPLLARLDPTVGRRLAALGYRRDALRD